MLARTLCGGYNECMYIHTLCMATKIANVQFRSYDTLVEHTWHHHMTIIRTYTLSTTNSVLVITFLIPKLLEGVRVYGFITDRAALSASNCAKQQEKHDKLLNQQITRQ